jgi:hypothetical protein
MTTPCTLCTLLQYVCSYPAYVKTSSTNPQTQEKGLGTTLPYTKQKNASYYFFTLWAIILYYLYFTASNKIPSTQYTDPATTSALLFHTKQEDLKQKYKHIYYGLS